MPCVVIAGYDQLTIRCQVKHISQVWYVSHWICRHQTRCRRAQVGIWTDSIGLVYSNNAVF